jgi:hypothetical protein
MAHTPNAQPPPPSLVEKRVSKLVCLLLLGQLYTHSHYWYGLFNAALLCMHTAMCAIHPLLNKRGGVCIGVWIHIIPRWLTLVNAGQRSRIALTVAVLAVGLS